MFSYYVQKWNFLLSYRFYWTAPTTYFVNHSIIIFSTAVEIRFTFYSCLNNCSMINRRKNHLRAGKYSTIVETEREASFCAASHLFIPLILLCVGSLVSGLAHQVAGLPVFTPNAALDNGTLDNSNVFAIPCHSTCLNVSRSFISTFSSQLIWMCCGLQNPQRWVADSR